MCFYLMKSWNNFQIFLEFKVSLSFFLQSFRLYLFPLCANVFLFEIRPITVVSSANLLMMTHLQTGFYSCEKKDERFVFSLLFFERTKVRD